MSDKCFVDTNVLVYAHDRRAGRKHERAVALLEDLWQSANGVLSTQVLQELCINLRRRLEHPLPIEEVRHIIQDYLRWEVVANGPEAVIEALDIEARYRISFWDALIVRAAESAGASVLYSEDLSAGQKLGTVRIVNPFSDSGRGARHFTSD